MAGDQFKDIVGSAYYIAPEVFKRRYGPEVDIWSVGLMLYILLCGVPPLWAESENGIFNAILQGHVDFSSDPWPCISNGAKDLVRKMLNSDPKQRLTAFQVLNHPWIKEDGEAPDTPLDDAVLDRLKQFRPMNKFKKVALRVLNYTFLDKTRTQKQPRSCSISQEETEGSFYVVMMLNQYNRHGMYFMASTSSIV